MFGRLAAEHLLDMDVHLAEEGRRDREAVTLVSEDRYSLLNAERLEDGLGDPQWQTVEGTDNDNALISFRLGCHALANGGNGFAKDGRRDVS